MQVINTLSKKPCSRGYALTLTKVSLVSRLMAIITYYLLIVCYHKQQWLFYSPRIKPVGFATNYGDGLAQDFHLFPFKTLCNQYSSLNIKSQAIFLFAFCDEYKISKIIFISRNNIKIYLKNRTK